MAEQEAPKARAKAKTNDDAELSAADLELSTAAAPAGETIIRKVNAETPTAAQVEAASGEVAGPPVTAVTVTDADGEETSAELSPDDAALISSRVFSNSADHPGHAPGYSNPALKDRTEEENEADQKAYAERIG